MQYKIKNTAIKAKAIVTKNTQLTQKVISNKPKITLATQKTKQNKLKNMKLTKRKNACSDKQQYSIVCDDAS